MSFLLLPLLFFVISLIYSSAGFGGGSMYLAILSGAIFTLALPQGEIKTLALLCNAAVATYSSIQFIRNKFIDWKSNLLLLSLSVPFVLLATLIKLEEKVFLLFLSIGLLLSAFFMVIFRDGERNAKLQRLLPYLSLLIHGPPWFPCFSKRIICFLKVQPIISLLQYWQVL